MPRKLSKQREDVIDLVRREGKTSPQRASVVLNVRPATARKLLFTMLSDGQLTSPKRGVYELPEEETLPDLEDVTEDAPDVTGPEESPIDPPILERSGSGVYAYSVERGGMISNESLRASKGYR
jgi:hypothetical protein